MEPDIIYMTNDVIASNNIQGYVCNENKTENGIKYVRYDKVIELIKHQKSLALGFSYEHLKMLQHNLEEL